VLRRNCFAQLAGHVNGRHCRQRVGISFAGIAKTLPFPACQSRHDRSLRRTNKPCVSLGDKMRTADLVAPKPKGMSQRTCQRKRVEIEWCEGQANHLFAKRFAHELPERPVLSWQPLDKAKAMSSISALDESPQQLPSLCFGFVDIVTKLTELAKNSLVRDEMSTLSSQ
jgi:hypothetical protein